MDVLQHGIEILSVILGIIILLLTSINVIVYWRNGYVLGLRFNKDKLTSLHHGGELVADVLKAHNVKHVFTLIGGHISPVLVGAQKVGIQVIDTRHEATAVFAADAIARLTGNIGVAIVTAGPGVTNTITAVKNAQMAQSPVLLIGGAAPTLLKGRGALQDIDQLSLFKTLCKYCKSVQTVRDIIPVIRKSIQIAMSDTPGPVFVELPVNILYPYAVVEKEMRQNKTGSSLMSSIVSWYLDWCIYDIFVDGFLPQEMKPLHVKVPRSSYRDVEKTLKLLSQAKRPVIIFGSQALIPATLAFSLRIAVENLGVPFFLGGMSRGLVGSKSTQQLRHTRRAVLKESDLVILAGVTCDFRLSYGKIFSHSCKIVIINRNKKEMLKNSDLFWRPTLAIEGCVSDFIISLSTEKETGNIDQNWLRHIRERDLAKEVQIRKMAEEVPEHHLNPLHVLHDLEESLDLYTVLIADGGDFVATASYILKPRGPLRWLDPGAFGTLGVGAGFAIAAKLCYPSRDVVILFGDGSLGYSLIEFDTFVRHKLPIVAVVGNDACWTQISREQVPLFRSNVGCSLNYSNYHKAVEGIGGKGILVTAEDKDNLKQKFKTALEMSKKGDSVLVNVFISSSSFREGSISV